MKKIAKIAVYDTDGEELLGFESLKPWKRNRWTTFYLRFLLEDDGTVLVDQGSISQNRKRDQ